MHGKMARRSDLQLYSFLSYHSITDSEINISFLIKTCSSFLDFVRLGVTF